MLNCLLGFIYLVSNFLFYLTLNLNKEPEDINRVGELYACFTFRVFLYNKRESCKNVFK